MKSPALSEDTKASSGEDLAREDTASAGRAAKLLRAEEEAEAVRTYIPPDLVLSFWVKSCVLLFPPFF